MASNLNESSGKSEDETSGQVLSLVQLLEEDQPYESKSRLSDIELLPIDENDRTLLKIQGSLVGLAVGDALGASVEFRPHSFMVHNQVTGMQSGGTWGLEAGQWTDDTSMALCLAASLIVKGTFDGYDQMTRYLRWFRNGYMSSTGRCFDIGGATREAVMEFEHRQRSVEGKAKASEVNPNCGDPSAAGNGPLMRLAPIPLFYHDCIETAIQQAAASAELTHGDKRALDACRFYAALIWNAINGMSKDELLNPATYRDYFRSGLHPEVAAVKNGSYKNKKKGYEDGIRGAGFIVRALEAALWALDNDEGSFERGVLAAVNLGDDADTTAAIYGQLAGALYGLKAIPSHWRSELFQADFIVSVASGLYVKGRNVGRRKRDSSTPDDKTDQKRKKSSDADENEDSAKDE